MARVAVRNQLNIRATREQRDVIDRAAALTGKSRTDFILESAVRDAQHVLLDARFFMLDEKAFQGFVDLLDQPPAPSARLRELLRTPSPWE
jgi:uncharacterized protein (DUF1778 family)